MTPYQVKKKKRISTSEKSCNLFSMLQTPSELVLSKNSIVISLVQLPCSFLWTALQA